VAGWEDGGEGSEDGEELMATASGEGEGELNKAHSTALRRSGRRHVVAFRGYSETTRYSAFAVLQSNTQTPLMLSGALYSGVLKPSLVVFVGSALWVGL
jgi:hypothetical protein